MKKNLYTLFTAVALLLTVSASRAQTITFMVDMTNYLAIDTNAISPNGVHMTGNFTNKNWTPEDATYHFTQVGASNVYSFTMNRADTAQFLEPAASELVYKFKFINSFAANFSWGSCHRDQECLPAGTPCTDPQDNRSLGALGSLPPYDAVYYAASWDSCAGTYLAPVGIQQVYGGVASLNVYPNLVSNYAEVNYVLLKNAKVNVTVRSYTGMVIQTLVDKQQTPGEYRMNINADNFSNGIYFVQANVNGNTFNKRFVVSH